MHAGQAVGRLHRGSCQNLATGRALQAQNTHLAAQHAPLQGSATVLQYILWASGSGIASKPTSSPEGMHAS